MVVFCYLCIFASSSFVHYQVSLVFDLLPSVQLVSILVASVLSQSKSPDLC